MGVPKRKRSRPRRDKRHANKGLKVKAMAVCAQCQASLSSHSVCPTCGYYKGVKVLVTKLERAVKRGQVREAKAQRVQASQTAAAPQEQ